MPGVASAWLARERHIFRMLAPRSDTTGMDRACWAARYQVGISSHTSVAAKNMTSTATAMLRSSPRTPRRTLSLCGKTMKNRSPTTRHDCEVFPPAARSSASLLSATGEPSGIVEVSSLGSPVYLPVHLKLARSIGLTQNHSVDLDIHQFTCRLKRSCSELQRTHE